MSFRSEFKEFIARGNVMDMAVGIIIGGAFTAIVTSLTDSIIQPLISLFGTGELGALGIALPNGQVVNFGAFISAIINFLIIALVVFFLVKGVNKMKSMGDSVTGKKVEEAAATPTCPFCMEEIKEGATRCPHCAADLGDVA